MMPCVNYGQGTDGFRSNSPPNLTELDLKTRPQMMNSFWTLIRTWRSNVPGPQVCFCLHEESMASTPALFPKYYCPSVSPVKMSFHHNHKQTSRTHQAQNISVKCVAMFRVEPRCVTPGDVAVLVLLLITGVLELLLV